MSECISLAMGHRPQGHQRQAEGNDMFRALKILLRMSTKIVLLLPVLDNLSHQGQVFSACHSQLTQT